MACLGTGLSSHGSDNRILREGFISAVGLGWQDAMHKMCSKLLETCKHKTPF